MFMYYLPVADKRQNPPAIDHNALAALIRRLQTVPTISANEAGFLRVAARVIKHGDPEAVDNIAARVRALAAGEPLVSAGVLASGLHGPRLQTCHIAGAA